MFLDYHEGLRNKYPILGSPNRLANAMGSTAAGRPETARIPPGKRRPLNPRGGFVAVTDFCFLYVHSLKQAPPLPSIADADHRDLAARSSTSIKEVVITDVVIKYVGAVPADRITNFRPLFPVSLQQTVPARLSSPSRPVLSV